MFEGTRKFVRQLALASVSATALMPLYSAPVQAQALQPVVDVCTGITLPRSAVTEVIGAVNQPLVSSLQTRVNALTNVEVLGLPLLNLPDVNIDLTSILADAAAGDPISLQILDTDGNVVGAGNCNIAADAITLNQEGGISIGGNSITGLGTDGQGATAGEQSAIAFGNNASTAVGATGAVAIGTGASVTAANGVAIGAGALADRGAQTNYVAPFITGLSSSIGSVSVGTAGGLRQITNVAPGTAPSDAATVGQVQGVIDAVGNLGGLAVQYTDATQAAVTLGGATGTTISNLAPGTLSAASTEAVNGSQLFATNGLVAGNTAAIGANTAAIGVNTTAIGANTTAIAAIDGRVTTNTGAIAALDAAAVQYDDATHQTVTLDGAGGTRLTNVSVGALDAASTDAVNGSQLFATNQQVAGNTTAIGANTGAITALDGRVTTNTGAITAIDGRVTTNTGAIAALDAAAVQYDDPSHAVVTFDGAAGTLLTNVTAGTLSAASTDAVNGAQLFATN